MNKFTRFIAISICAATLAFPALAMDLGSAKQNGTVGELRNGLIASIQEQPNAEVHALIEETNRKRLERYQQIAKQNGTSLQSVQALAGAQLIAKSPAGMYVESEDGGWAKK